ncbi:hypothetical protein Golob_018068, partial [Gossypium lobatum]|nr:hypothetical protein [Gossypium lobatum]
MLCVFWIRKLMQILSRCCKIDGTTVTTLSFVARKMMPVMVSSLGEVEASKMRYWLLIGWNCLPLRRVQKSR